MGEMPPAVRDAVGDGDVAAATDAFRDAVTQIAMDFIEQWVAGGRPADNILPRAPDILGQPVKLSYINSGSVGSVYKIQWGDQVWALKINRNASAGELGVMPLQSRVRGLVNKMHMGAVFKYGNRRYSWVLSDYVGRDRAGSFERAMEKLYYAYLTKGIDIADAHAQNFIDGKLIDQASLFQRTGCDDIRALSRGEQDMVKKLAHAIRTDNATAFEKMMASAAQEHPAVVRYMFFAMKFGKSPIFGPGHTDPFSMKLARFEEIVNRIYRGMPASKVGPRVTPTSHGR